MYERPHLNAMKETRAPMKKRRGFTVVVVGAAILLVAHTAGAQTAEKSGDNFKARLSVVPIDVSMMPTIAGSGSLTAVLAGRKLTITGTFEGLRSPATVAQIHRGPKGIRGPAVFDLAVTKATSGTVSGSLDLTPAQIEELRSGRLYVQIHSERAPDGNLWGWLLR
jgi:DNA-binding transcriptional regulator YdaS (Cro superfamily)